MLFVSILLFSFQISKPGETHLEVAANSSVKINIEPSFKAILLFSNVPNSSYLITEGSNSDSEKRIELPSLHSFSVSDINEFTLFSNNSTFVLTVWIIPHNLCSNGIRVFKTFQFIIIRWDLIDEIENTCYFPIDKGSAALDITMIYTYDSMYEQKIVIYNESLEKTSSHVKGKSNTQINGPFFLLLEYAAKDTVVAYDIRYNQPLLYNSDCFDMPTNYFINGSFYESQSMPFIEFPGLSCSGSHYWRMFNIIFSFLAGVIIIVISILLFFVIKFTFEYCMSCLKGGNSAYDEVRLYN